MRFIAKTLVLSPSPAKWAAYRAHFHASFAGLDAKHDELVAFYADFHDEFEAFPSLEAFRRELSAANDTKLLDHLLRLAQDPSVPVHAADDVFMAALEAERLARTKAEVADIGVKLQKSVEGPAVRLPQLLQAANTVVSDLHEACGRLRRAKPVSLLHYGEEAQRDFRAHYEALEARKAKEGDLYYALPFPRLDDVQIKRGDLLCVGAFTSQGKSSLLRFLAYHLMTAYGLNVLFCSLEVDARTVQRQFAVLHANNKDVFPHAPRIRERDFKNAELSDEGKDFLLTVAFKDFTENPNYGTLQIDERGEARFSLPELMRRVSEAARTMPVQVLVVDYVTAMAPLTSDRWRPQPDDYNQLIRDLKAACMAHHFQGQPAPIICLTAAQVSRTAYREALKQDERYGLDAFSLYTEVERSADVALTLLMTPEMRAASQVRVQVQKNRDGNLPTEPVDLHVDLGGGMRFEEMLARSPEEVCLAIESLNI